jgi:iron complex outermembrane recepter protein
VSTATTAQTYEAEEVQPRVTLTKRWSEDLMTYGSIARGFRGGGQNGPGAPNLIYEGDSVWTYELGAKFVALNNRLSLDTAIFFNDYSDFIGPNALAPSTTGVGFVAINLNAGDVETYGFEAEGTYQITDNWNIRGNVTLLNARVTDSSQFEATTSFPYPGDRILLVPDWTFNLGTNYRWDLGAVDSLVFDAAVVGKSDRTGATFDATDVAIMPEYYLANASLAWRHDNVEIALFATNLFDEEYQEVFIDSSVLSAAGFPPGLASDVSIQGNRQRVGIRASVDF